MGIWDEIVRTFKSGNNLTRLIFINTGVFLLITLASIIGFLMSNDLIASKVVSVLSVPAHTGEFIRRPWTLVTYMFTHKDLLHILFNMLWLYWFGKIFLEYLDQKKLVAVYLTGGLAGAVLYIVSFNIFPAFRDIVSASVAIGASASVMAVVIAIATWVPDYTINLFLLGRIKLKYMALAMFILTSFVDFSVNSGGKIAHIGGALAGYFYAISLRKGSDPGKWINSIIGFFATMFRPRTKMKVTYRKPATDFDYNRAKAENQARINSILDKISKGGYDSLTREEKEILFRESQKKS